MSQFLSTLLVFFQAYGYPALWITIFTAAVGAPLPIDLLMLAAGAFAALGDFNIVALTLIGISASVCGDNVGYLVGRMWGSRALDWLERSRVGKRVLPPRAIAHSRAYFTRYGGWAVFLTRFLIGALGGVTNLVAGSERFPYRAFLACDITGEILGAVLPLALGFAFGASWEDMGDVLNGFSLLLLVLLVAALLLVYLLRHVRNGKEPVKKFGLTPRDRDVE